MKKPEIRSKLTRRQITEQIQRHKGERKTPSKPTIITDAAKSKLIVVQGKESETGTEVTPVACTLTSSSGDINLNVHGKWLRSIDPDHMENFVVKASHQKWVRNCPVGYVIVSPYSTPTL